MQRRKREFHLEEITSAETDTIISVVAEEAHEKSDLSLEGCSCSGVVQENIDIVGAVRREPRKAHS